jgi:hypothetical protein
MLALGFCFDHFLLLFGFFCHQLAKTASQLLQLITKFKRENKSRLIGDKNSV